MLNKVLLQLKMVGSKFSNNYFSLGLNSKPHNYNFVDASYFSQTTATANSSFLNSPELLGS